MLIVVSVTLCLCAAAIVASAKVVTAVMGRLGVDALDVLLFCGLAEWPSESRAPRRERVDTTVRDRRRSRRSPHRALGRLAARRP